MIQPLQAGGTIPAARLASCYLTHATKRGLEPRFRGEKPASKRESPRDFRAKHRWFNDLAWSDPFATVQFSETGGRGMLKTWIATLNI